MHVELTAINALTLLKKAGFDGKENWNMLGAYLGVPLGQITTIQEAVDNTTLTDALEALLEWWISSQKSSWELLISSAEKCSDSSTADNMRKQLGLGMLKYTGKNEPHLLPYSKKEFKYHSTFLV